MSSSTIVLKFGGSVLADAADLSRGVHEIYRWVRRGYRVVAVVSALNGVTDQLTSAANAIDPDGPEDPRALLLATGELAVAAQLGLALSRAGIPSATLNPHQLALRTSGSGVDADPSSIDAASLQDLLRTVPVAVVPGFVGIGPRNELTLLGRGGSDLTALFIASTLNARCRLIKDVDGLYERDPALPGPKPRRYQQLDWDRALTLDGQIVQHKAVRLAKRRGLSFEVGSFQRDDVSIITHGEHVWHRDASNPDPAAPLRVALLGLGTVGVGVLAHLLRHPDRFAVSGVLVNDATKARPDVDRLLAQLPPEARPPITDDPVEATINADVVVELIGGIERARTFVIHAIQSRAHVITANKALLCEHGDELLALAQSQSVSIRYSAAVGGSVPMLETVQRHAASIQSIEGVVNGTTNYILESIARGNTFNNALATAQQLGYAEADPSRDLSGADALDKIILLARSAYASSSSPEPIRIIRRIGLNSQILDTLRPDQPADARIRLVAWARRGPDAIEVGVEPRVVPASHPLSPLPDATNRLVLHTVSGSVEIVDGAGAGRWPTAESVFADLLDLHRQLASHRGTSLEKEVLNVA